MNALKSAGASLLMASGPGSPEAYSPAIRKGNSSMNLTNVFGSAEDQTTQLANTAGGYNSEDQMTANAADGIMPVSGFVYTQQTI